MLKKIRVTLAIIFFVGLFLLFLDFTGLVQDYLGFMAKIQFMPAVLAVNVAVIVGLIILTLLFGRLYCSVICPLGVYQDGVSHISKSRKRHKNPYKYVKRHRILRGIFLVLFIALMAFGLQAYANLIEPYSNFGMIVQNLVQPLYIGINNLLAKLSEHLGGFAFYTREVWMRSLPAIIVSAVLLILVTILAWRDGRAYCNSVCPVGTILGFFSRFAMFRPVIDKSKCVKCGKCEKNCKSKCINVAEGEIDHSRCVDCFNCIENCKFKALKYEFAWKKSQDASALEEAVSDAVAKPAEAHSDAAGQPADPSRRAFMIGGAVLGGSLMASAQEKKLDGGLADVHPKQTPERRRPLTPAGSESIDEFYRKCTSCQLCVAECPNNVLRPSKDFKHFLQPEMGFEHGYCRPECVKCSQVCPAGAIVPITKEEKTAYKIGTAEVNLDLCITNTRGKKCGNCARHCPVGAIMLVKKNPDDNDSVRIPSVREERCIGCGACEHLCPVRPVSAITVVGVESHLKN
ncbi:MAG: 4Fe-4S dicluster domain-containing protein [Bacteroidales bacterium]|nr:4Fe-4S dicluster domain-containing protein [Bacteroidales bacterium]